MRPFSAFLRKVHKVKGGKCQQLQSIAKKCVMKRAFLFAQKQNVHIQLAQQKRVNAEIKGRSNFRIKREVEFRVRPKRKT